MNVDLLFIWINNKLIGLEYNLEPYLFYILILYTRSIPNWKIYSIPLFHTSIPYLYSIPLIYILLYIYIYLKI